MRRNYLHPGPVLVDNPTAGGQVPPPRGPAGAAANSTQPAGAAPDDPSWDGVTSPATVTVVGLAGRLHNLADHLPGNWHLRWVGRTDELDHPELVLIIDATGDTVARARQRCPDAVVLAAVSADAPVHVVVDVLHAGADGCVRSHQGPIVAAHLRACQRRKVDRQVGRRVDRRVGGNLNRQVGGHLNRQVGRGGGTAELPRAAASA